MAMGMKMGQLDDIKTIEDNVKNNLNIDDKEKPREEITSKEIKKANEELKNPKLRQQLKWLKVLIEKKKSLPRKQEEALDKVLDDIKDELLQSSELFSEKDWLITTWSKDGNLDQSTLAKEIAEHVDADTFKILKLLIKNPKRFGAEFWDEYEGVVKDLKKTVENIWKELQLQDKQQQIDKVKAVTKVTKGK